jgi:glycosyltransferase involved in cell wall biosynthesis
MRRLAGRDILIFGEDWGRFPSTTQHIGKVLMGRNRVMWVGSLGHRKPRLSLADVRRAAEKITYMLFGARVFGRSKQVAREADGGGVAVEAVGGESGDMLRRGKAELSTPEQVNIPILVHPFWIPWHDSRIIRRLNRFLLARRLRGELQRHGFQNVVVITSSPLVAQVLPDLDVQSAHYLCLDDYSEFDDAFDAMLPMERELLTRADTCFAVSDILAVSRRPVHGESYTITQGVDTRHFTKVDKVAPVELSRLPGPIVGFFGLVSEWVDVALIMYAAEKLPGFTFVVIGKATVDLSDFSRFDNIVYTGLVPYSQLPAYASVFDVGSIPFKVNELTLACNPLKMFEYFALGLPVVSTALPEVEKYAPDVFIARDKDEYVSLLRQAAGEAGPECAGRMRALAERYSWEAVSAFIEERIS